MKCNTMSVLVMLIMISVNAFSATAKKQKMETEEYIPKAADFRVVTGQVFNIERSILWSYQTDEFTIVELHEKGAICERKKAITEPIPRMVNRNQRIGSFSSVASLNASMNYRPSTRIIGYESLGKVFVNNVTKDHIKRGIVDGKMMQVDNVNINGQVYPSFDFGLLNIPENKHLFVNKNQKRP